MTTVLILIAALFALAPLAIIRIRHFNEYRQKQDERRKVTTYEEAARVTHLWLNDYCDESLDYPAMVADACRTAKKEIDKLKNIQKDISGLVRIEERRGLYRKLLLKYGAKAQVTVCIEECAELQKELCKHLNNRLKDKCTLVDELADVQIMVEQMVEIFNVREDFYKKINEKIQRVSKRHLEVEEL